MVKFASFIQVTVFDQQTQRKMRALRAGNSGERNRTLAWKTIEGLSQHTSYIIRVQAKNKAGLSKSADEIFVKTRGAFYWSQTAIHVALHLCLEYSNEFSCFSYKLKKCAEGAAAVLLGFSVILWDRILIFGKFPKPIKVWEF